MRLQIVAKAIILNSTGQVLLLKRSPTDPRRPGEWDFPGGEINPGEEITQGVCREILEETSLRADASKVKLVFAASQPYPEVSVTRLLFIAQIGNSDVKLSHEHDSFRWTTVSTVLELFPHPFYGSGLKYALDHDLMLTNSKDAA